MRDLSDRKLEEMFQLDDRPGPARPADDAALAAIIAGALGGAGFAPPIAARAPAAGGHGAAAATAAKGLGVVKLALLAGGAAGVALIGWVWLRSPAAPRVTPPPAVAITAPAPAAVPPSEPAPPPPAAVAEPDDPDPEIEPEIEPARPAIKSKPTPSHRHPARVAVAAPPVAPEDLLAAANAARVAHHWRKADALYARVVSGGQAELAVQAALVASASLHLEHLGDPAGAVRRFRAALAAGPRDALAEDARWGLAESTRATGDAAGEAAALDDFLAHHAGSPRAARARARRGELQAQP